MVWEGVGTLLLVGGLLAGVVWIVIAAGVGEIPKVLHGLALWLLVPLAWLGSLGVVLAGGSVGAGWAVLLGLLAATGVACAAARMLAGRRS